MYCNGCTTIFDEQTNNVQGRKNSYNSLLIRIKNRLIKKFPNPSKHMYVIISEKKNFSF